jgi:hypothetical protein
MRTCVRRVIIMRLSVRVRRCSNAVFIAISRCNATCHNRAGGAPCNCCTGSSRLLKQLLLLSHLLRHCPAAVSFVRAAPLELNSEQTTAICTCTHVRANAQDSRHSAHAQSASEMRVRRTLSTDSSTPRGTGWPCAGSPPPCAPRAPPSPCNTVGVGTCGGLLPA